MNNTPAVTLVSITSKVENIAAEYAQNIGWGRDVKKFLLCLCCSRRCHYNRYPETQQKFWADVWQALSEHGIDPALIQEAMRQKLQKMPWDQVIPYTQDDIEYWISAQLNCTTGRPGQP